MSPEAATPTRSTPRTTAATRGPAQRCPTGTSATTRRRLPLATLLTVAIAGFAVAQLVPGSTDPPAPPMCSETCASTAPTPPPPESLTRAVMRPHDQSNRDQGLR